MKKSLLIFYFFLFFVYNVAGQKRFHVTIEVPQELDSTKLKLAYDNGKTEIPIKKYRIENHKIILSELFYGNYAAVILRYPKSINTQYQNSFFVSNRPANIVLCYSDSLMSPFRKYKLRNARDFKKIKNELLEHSSAERKKISDLFLIDAKKNDHSNDSISNFQFNTYNKNLLRKDLDFILKNNTSYYSFWFFRRNIVPSSIQSADSLLYIFNTLFSKKFKLTEEGNTIRKFLLGRMAVQSKNAAPDFISKSIDNRKITLSEYQGKKNVLIIFWAIWCNPCLEEIPIIKRIWEKYSGENLEIIYVSYASDYLEYLKFIKEKKINWVNIYNDADLINSYGGYKAIPRIYLINTLGKIVYNKDIDDVYDPQLSNLKYLLESMLNSNNRLN